MNNTILITGAAGNLGGLLAAHLKDRNLHLLIHKKDVADELKNKPNIQVFRADLADKESLYAPLENVSTIVHFAGVLFKAGPEKFLPTTNIQYFKNLLDVAVERKVKKIILISFPHVEGETTPQSPAKGDMRSLVRANPDSVHAKTRRQEEEDMFVACKMAVPRISAVSLRLGMVYGKGILMPDTAEWFGRRWLLGVWREPTYIHLISKDDFLSATTAAIDESSSNGIYHIGDDGIQTLQQFLDRMAEYKRFHKPWRMPLWLIKTAAQFFEIFSAIFGTRSPLTKDFVTIGQISYYGDTARMKAELLPILKYKTFEDGLETM